VKGACIEAIECGPLMRR